MRWIARDCLNRRLRRFSQMGCDASRPFSRWLLYRGLRVLSGPRITRIFADAPPVCLRSSGWTFRPLKRSACAGMTVGGLGRWAVMPRAFLAWSLFESGIARVVCWDGRD